MDYNAALVAVMATLGLSPDAPWEYVRSACTRLVLQLSQNHLGPDAQGETARLETIFQVYGQLAVWYWVTQRAPPPAVWSLAELQKLVPPSELPPSSGPALAPDSEISSPSRTQQAPQSGGDNSGGLGVSARVSCARSLRLSCHSPSPP